MKCGQAKVFFGLKTLPVLLAMQTAVHVHALPLVWGDGASNMQWDTVSQNWLSGATPTTWNNAADDDAVFGAAGIGTVNLLTGIAADSLTFKSAGYTIAGNTLTLAGPNACVTNNADATIASTLAGSAGLAKAGNGTLTLAGNLAYTGQTTVNAGRLVVTGNQNFQDLGYAEVSIASGATLAISYTNVNYLYGQQITSITNLTGAGTFEFDSPGTGAPFHNETGNPSTIAMSGGLFHIVTGTFHNGWGHTGNWSKNRAGLTVESGATFDLWDLPLSPGYCFDALNGAGAIQATEGLPDGGPQILDIGLANGSGTFTGSISDANGNTISLIKDGTGTQILSGNLSYSGGTTVNDGCLEVNSLPGSATTGAAVNIAAGLLQVNYSNGQQTEIYNLTGGGTFQFNCTNGYAVPFYNPNGNICAISLRSGAVFHVLSGTVRNAWSHNNIWDNNRSGLTVEGGAVFDLWDNPLGAGYCFDGLNGAGSVTSDEGNNPNTLYLGLAGGSGTFNGVISDANNSPITLIKSGTGTQVLSGNNSYSGPTIVSNGTLEVDGSLGGSSAVSVHGGTLDGVGTVNGPLIVASGGTLAAGNTAAPGTLTIGNAVTLSSGSAMAMRINNGGSGDRLAGMSSLTYGGTLDVTNVGGALALGNTFTLFQAGAYGGSFSNYNLPALPAGLYWSLSSLAVNGSIMVTNLPQIRTVVSLTSAPNPSNFGSKVQFVATVLTNGTAAGNATGSIVFSDSGTSLGAIALSGGRATLNNSALSIGVHQITAFYGGDINYEASASVPLSQNVQSSPLFTLENNAIRASFNARGLASIYDKYSGELASFNQDEFYVSPGSDTISSTNFTPVVEAESLTNITYQINSGQWTVQANYQLEPNWKFISKQISISTQATNDFMINEVNPVQGILSTPIASQQSVSSGELLRFNDGNGTQASHGLFVELQTAPQYTDVSISGQALTVSCSPGLNWNMSYGPFQADCVLLGPDTLSGITYPTTQISEWQYLPNGARIGGTTIDRNELDALWSAVEAFLLWRPTHTTRIHIAWGETDSQIDLGTAAGQTEYQRILQQAANVGCNVVLCDAQNSLLSNPAYDTDSWGWENVLWFGLGQEIRSNWWYPGNNAIPSSVQTLLNNAQSNHLKLAAYAYPSLPFEQNSAWTAWPGNFADLGQRSFQDWWVELATNFQNATGISGFSFDYVLLGNGNAPSSPYAQWYGWRRVLQNIRRQFPTDIIDGRQQFNTYGVWTWLACTYPHPITGDEQPMSFTSFPDLHWARVCADRQRWAAWWYRVQNLTPIEITPGYITQQTPRLDANGNYIKYSPLHTRDWDYLGWRYSVISTIGTAPFNLVVNDLPARDTNEFNAFSSADQQWMRGWFDWTDQHLDVLRHLRPIISQPQLGLVDGTAAFTNGHGFVFLFNPNYRPLTAQFNLDNSIGLTNGGPFILRQLYPDAEKGKLILPPSGAVWNLGESVSLPMPGADALVLEITNVPPVTQPLLLGAAGAASYTNGQLALTNICGQVGMQSAIQVLMPAGQTVYGASVNGLATGFNQSNNIVSLSLNFAGIPFQRLQQIGSYDPDFAGGIYSNQITIPSAVFQQLAAETNAWPVPYTPDDLLATWLGSYRLLLFVNIANPNPSMAVSLSIDGQSVALTPAYMTIYPLGYNNTFVGWYADLSRLAPDTSHQFQLTLPALAAGQFQGMFLDNVEAQFTNSVILAGTATAITLSASPNPSAQGGRVTFNASVLTNGLTAGDAGGSVVFLDNQMPLSTNAVIVGTASYSTTNLPVGTNIISAAYSGCGPYQPNLSAPVEELVQPLPSTPANLIWQSNGSNLMINWPSNYLGWILQTQTDSLGTGLGTDWVNLPDTDATTSVNFLIFPQNPAVFYRLRHP